MSGQTAVPEVAASFIVILIILLTILLIYYNYVLPLEIIISRCQPFVSLLFFVSSPQCCYSEGWVSVARRGRGGRERRD